MCFARRVFRVVRTVVHRRPHQGGHGGTLEEVVVTEAETEVRR